MIQIIYFSGIYTPQLLPEARGVYQNTLQPRQTEPHGQQHYWCTLRQQRETLQSAMLSTMTSGNNNPVAPPHPAWRDITLWLAIGLLLAACALWWQAQRQSNNYAVTYSYAGAVQQVADAVVSLDIRRNVPNYSTPLAGAFSGRQQTLPQNLQPDPNNPNLLIETSGGSGVVISGLGHILTNHHVVADAREVNVRFNDGRSATAELIGNDPETDLALLKVKLPELAHARFAPPGRVQVGDVVLAIGNPFGVGQTVTQGIISATGRSGLALSTFESFLQTDAAINPGNSGGALVNVRGELIGINTALFSRSGGSQGIGFAIPAALAEAVMQQLIENGEVVRGWLGVVPQPLTSELTEGLSLPNGRGLLVANVIPGSPAQRAGVRRGDILLYIDEQPMNGPRDALEYVAGRSPGDRVALDLVRRGVRQSLEVQISRRTVNRQSGR